MYGNIRATPLGCKYWNPHYYDNDDPNTTDDLSDDIEFAKVLKKRAKRYYLGSFEPWTSPEHIEYTAGEEG